MKLPIKSMLAGCVLGLLAASHISAATVLRFAEGSPNRGARAAAVQFLADEVERLSGGDLKFQIHWGGALLKYSAILDGVNSGTADIGSVLSAYEPKKLKGLGIGDLPLENADPWVGMRAMYELMTTNEQLQAMMAKQNVVYVSNFTTTGVQFECTGDHQILTVEDIAGKRMRASSTYAKVLDDLGANMVNLTYDEVYQALDSGLIDCTAGHFFTMRTYKTFEVTDHITRADWGQNLGFVVAMNRDIWNDLAPEQQQLMREAGSNMVDYYAKQQIDEIDKTAKGLTTGTIGRKVPITTMDPQERQKLIDATQKYVKVWIEDVTRDGLDGQAIWDQYTALVTKYEQERDQRGYPWER
ncbi:MAG: C4-dicarboxylate TRAP transporter substrate-binding protein [Marinobacter sp.]